MKMKHWLNKYLPVMVFFLFGLILLIKPVQDMDEIWNYGFASYICQGLLPYKDFNMIQTPFSAFLAAGVLAVFGDNLTVFRILGILLFAFTFTSVHFICHRITVKRSLSFAVASFAGALCSLIWMYNYNHLNLCVILSIIGCEQFLEKHNQRGNLLVDCLIGLLYGFTPIIKQSTGAVLLLYNIGWSAYKMLTDRSGGKGTLLRIGLSFIPLSSLCMYLLATGTFMDFYDYAVMGVGSFTHHTTWIEYVMSGPIDFALGIFPLVATGCSIYTLKKNNSRISRNFHLGTLLLCWAGAIVAYPICDFVHMCVAAVPFVIPLLCCLGQLRISLRDGIICSFAALIVLTVTACIQIGDTEGYKTCELAHFEGLPISSTVEEQINAVDSYIISAAEDGIEVIVADEDAAAYMIPVDTYYKDFNLLLVGNLGTKSVQDLLWRDNVVYLVSRDDSLLGYQAHTELIEYIKENYIKIGEVSGFDAYAPT